MTLRVIDLSAGIERAPTEQELAESQAAISAYVPPDLAGIDLSNLNAALSAEGSVVRALALVLLQEINTIRTRLPTPLPAYNTSQLIAALKSKMRS